MFVNVNPQSTLLLGQARGAAISAAVLARLPVREYTALQVKQAVVGHGKAAKEQVQEMVRRLLELARRAVAGRRRRTRLRDRARARDAGHGRTRRRQLSDAPRALHPMTRAPRPTRLPRAVVFDMDGLMLDTERIALRCWSAAAADSGSSSTRAAVVDDRAQLARFAALVLEHHGDDFPIDALMQESRRRFTTRSSPATASR